MRRATVEDVQRYVRAEVERQCEPTLRMMLSAVREIFTTLRAFESKYGLALPPKARRGKGNVVKFPVRRRKPRDGDKPRPQAS